MIALGAAGGGILGAVILVCYLLSGQRGTIPPDPVAVDSIFSSVILGFMYGVPLGAVSLPVGYGIFLRRTRLRPALWLAAATTFTGGCLGALLHPFAATEFGLLGFIIGCIIARFKFAA